MLSDERGVQCYLDFLDLRGSEGPFHPCGCFSQSGAETYVCCKCEPDANLDNRAPSLTNMFCDRHGECLHREMVRRTDGTLELDTHRYPPGRASNAIESQFAGGIFTERLRIHKLLQTDFHQALAEMNAASNDFQDVMREIPSGLPQPDGAQRIHNASRQYSTAREKLMKARTRFDNFAIHGIVPDDLKKSG